MFAESVPGFRPLHENLVSKSDNATTLTEQWRLEAPLRYCHLAADELQLVDTVLRGWCPLEGLPNIKSRIVRIFISSTFSGMSRIIQGCPMGIILCSCIVNSRLDQMNAV